MGVISIDGERVDLAIGEAVECLRRAFRKTANGAGWYHYFDDDSPGVTASAVGLYVMKLAGERFDRASDVIEYLISQQVDSEDATKGGWPVRTTGGFPILEATAWVVRALAMQPPTPEIAAAVSNGRAWIVRNQNDDHGWGSFKGQPSRVFLTCMALLALSEAGEEGVPFANGQRWLLSAQHPHVPAWGSLPQSDPTILHTSFSLQALSRSPGRLSASAIQETVKWLMGEVKTEEFTELATIAEDYDVPYGLGDTVGTFQNSLPHFSTPIAIQALLELGENPLSLTCFKATNSILEAQRDDGSWELPRSPTRTSIWAIWPFVAALATVRGRILGSSGATVDLLYDGCALTQTGPGAVRLTRVLLARKTSLFWLRNHLATIVPWVLVAILFGIAAVLWAMGESLTTYLVLTFTVIVATLQVLWQQRPMKRGS